MLRDPKHYTTEQEPDDGPPNGLCHYCPLWSHWAAASGCVGDAGVSGAGGTSGSGGSGGVGGNVVVSTSPLLPARIRRLTNAEYDASVRALLGTSMSMAATFPPDARQGIFSRGGYTLNDAQRVDPVLAKQLADSAIALVAESRQNAASRTGHLRQCRNRLAKLRVRRSSVPSGQGIRRPLSADEVSAYAASIAPVRRRNLRGGHRSDSARDPPVGGFCTHRDRGWCGRRRRGRQVTPYESASVMSYLLIAGPP